MRTRLASLVGLVAAFGLGCGGAATATPSTAVAAGANASDASPADATEPAERGTKTATSAPVDDRAVPSECTPRGDFCTPSPAFVKRLCAGFHPDVALAFFRKGTPFSRGYLAKNVQAWNASGGASSADKLAFDEEVVVLLSRQNETGIQVSGASGSYDVLRWDGTCATLASEELTRTPPPSAKHAKVLWKDLPDATQAALLADEAIAKLNKERRNECKGASMGDVSAKCVKLVDKQSDAIVAFVRAGGEVPLPARIE
jgi:hypothetical protein